MSLICVQWALVFPIVMDYEGILPVCNLMFMPQGHRILLKVTEFLRN